MESKEQNKLINKIETTEKELVVVREVGLGHWVKEVKGLRSKLW